MTGSRRVLFAEIEQSERGLRGAATLVELGWVAAGDRLRLVLNGEDSVADRVALQCQFHDPARAFVRDHFKMISLAANDDAERDEGAEAPASRGECDRARQLERPRHGQRFM